MENIQNKDYLDSKKTALVLIDLQNGLMTNTYQSPNSAELVVSNACKLAAAFTDKGALVVLVRVSTHDGKDMLQPITDSELPQHQYQAGWDQIVPELASFTNALIITKRQMGAFYGTELDLQLRRRGIDTIVLCGISTSIGVDTTAREAYQFGYNQIFAVDAMTARAKEEHEHVCKYIFPRLGRSRTVDEVIAMLG
ncbi:isochorismatase family protein [Anaerocolumna sp. MB42-C2]|uniref:isochorismatase family protein n=1 Tax=Anaerocolumna sp. MB42-C2 TaxID=3070997 RepID=UPI0027DFA7D9|nr:isochorismatase family protein [Anaerocolumna sp. MB42-C2]WMJ87016.1 isochorismatase family protein [Anaerocolumna sp. MB42-C2]